jgi:hypothetical protein
MANTNLLQSSSGFHSRSSYRCGGLHFLIAFLVACFILLFQGIWVSNQLLAQYPSFFKDTNNFVGHEWPLWRISLGPLQLPKTRIFLFLSIIEETADGSSGGVVLVVEQQEPSSSDNTSIRGTNNLSLRFSTLRCHSLNFSPEGYI